MKWLIREINKRPKLKKLVLYVIEMSRKSYMFLINKIIGINTNKIVFISFGGKSYSDNPKAVSEKLHAMYPNFEIVWLFNNPEERKKIVPDYVRCVNASSNKGLKELATSKVWVDNFTKPLWIYKSKQQYYIQTWHGDRAFKKILYDAWPNGKRPEPIIESEICDLAISGSDYGNMQYKSAFKYNGEILQVGYPRNDKLVNNNKNSIKLTKQLLGIKEDIKILLYAPTLRRVSSNNKTNQYIGEIDLIEVINSLEEKTNQKWVCLFRAHSAVKGLSGIPDTNKFINASKYEDMSDLLLISDMLITDYSSCAGDYALMEKPIILFQNDREEYIKKDRAFYFDIDESPYIVSMNQSELNKIIKNMDTYDFPQNCRDILGFYGTNETGRSSEAVVNYIISKIGEEK